MVRVLVNDAVKRYLLAAPESERKLIRKSFEYLENGLWEGGLRIKRLQGVSRAVLEARINRGDRLLFTLAREQEGVRALVVHVWAVVPHDDVERSARSIDPDSAPFLSFDARDVAEASDVDMDALDDSIVTSDRHAERRLTDSPPQRWFVLDDREWQRILLYSKDEFEIFLYLTPEQRSLLEKDPPLLVSGTAGSGKTTLSVYYLLRQRLLDRSCLFLTYNRHLRNFCQRLYAGLVNQRQDAPLRPAQFFTFKELCLNLVGKENAVRFAPDREVDALSFSGVFRRHRLSDRFDSAVVWEEIRSIIKGAKPQITAAVLRRILKEWSTLPQNTEGVRALREELLSLQQLSVREKAGAVLLRVAGCTLGDCIRELEDLLLQNNAALFRALGAVASEVEQHEADFKTPLMTLAEYEQIGHKRAPAFVHSRSDIYSIALWYQSQLEAEHRWDEIDLTRAAIVAMDRAPASIPRYDFVCCDEIQDFTGIQLSLLVRLPRSPEMLMLSGDPKQIINPSGFRWEEARGLFYERRLPVPEVHFLTLNFRCVGSIVALSNILLQIKQELLGVRSDEKPDESRFQGQPPFLVESVAPEAMLQSLRATGADRMILTREETERDRLKEQLETELVFTIEEAKGLEFRSVVLWKFCREGAVRDLWERILRADTAGIHDAAIRHELNLLYVGITRAQRNLIVYDGEQGSVIWRDPRIEDLVFRTHSAGYLEQVWRVVSSPEEWSSQGDYFMEHEHYRAAAECYRNAGLPQKMQQARARAAERRGEWPVAADCWEEAGELENAAEAWERAAGFQQAVALWELLGREDRALPCRVSLLEQEMRYAEAAELWEQMERWDRARQNWLLARRPDRLALLYEREEKWLDAAHCYRDSRQFEKAARLFERSQRWEDAARSFESAGRDAEAVRIWRRLKRDGEELACLQRMKDDSGLADYYERRQQWKKAMEYLGKVHGPDLHRAMEQQLAAMKSRNPGARALRLTLLGRNAEAAPLWERIREFEQAAGEYRLADDPEKAAQCYVRAERWAEALSLLADSGNLSTLRRFSQRWIGKDRPAAVNAISSLANDFFHRGMHFAAADLYSTSEKFLKAAECLAAGGDRETAVLVLSREENVKAIVSFLVQRQWWVDGAEAVVRRILLSGKMLPDYRPLEAFLKEWVASGIDEKDAPAFSRIVSEYSRDLPVTFVISILEKEQRYDEMMNAIDAFLGDSTTSEQEVLLPWIEKAAQKESAGDLAGAGARYLLMGEESNAFRCWASVEPDERNMACMERAGHPDRVIDFLERTGRILGAAAMCVQHRRNPRAVDLFQRAGKPAEGALLFESAGQYPEAAGLYSEAGEFAKAAALFERMKDFESAAGEWKKAGNPEREMECLSRTKAGKSSRKKERPARKR